MKIKEDVLHVLRESTVDEDSNTLFLPPSQLERKLYSDVNKCLESIGGKWNRKAKGHVFDHNPSDDLDEMIVTGEWADKKKEYQFFATPQEIVIRMINLAQINSADVILEPSAGDGAILEFFPKENAYIAIELMGENCETLRKKGYSVSQSDFLESPVLDVDKVLMNPPFTKQQDVKHVFHAWKCLSKGGRLVSIVSESPFFRENSLSRDFRDWLDINNAVVIDLDHGAFKSSGTMVKTRIIVVNKV
jgi:hypothetical protein